MSFFSGLEVFYPGRPPRMTVGNLRRFCDGLRALLKLRDNSLLRVELRCGDNDEKAFDALHEVQWDEAGVVGLLPLEEERQSGELSHEGRGAKWPALWPDDTFDTAPVLRASVHLGGLPKDACADLTAARQPDGYSTRSYIVPDGLSVSINPVYAMTLATELPPDTDVCYGFLGLSFSGNGYFTWQPLEAYWQSAGRTETLRKVLKYCREICPVPTPSRLDVLKESV